MKLTRLIFISTAVLLSACDDGPELGSRYELVSIDGQPLPYQIDGPVDPIHILDESMVIENGRVSIEAHVRFVLTQSADTSISTGTLDLPFEHVFNRLVLDPGEPAVPGTCEGAPIYLVVDDGEELHWTDNQWNEHCPAEVDWDQKVWVYERID